MTVFEPTGTDNTDVAFNDVCRGNYRAVKAMVLSLGGVTPCGNNIDTKRLDGDDFDPDLLTGPGRQIARKVTAMIIVRNIDRNVPFGHWTKKGGCMRDNRRNSSFT